MRHIFSLVLMLCGATLAWDGLRFANISLFLDDILPFGIHYTTFKFALADRSSIEAVGYGLAVVGTVIALIGLTRAIRRR